MGRGWYKLAVIAASGVLKLSDTERKSTFAVSAILGRHELRGYLAGAFFIHKKQQVAPANASSISRCSKGGNVFTPHD